MNRFPTTIAVLLVLCLFASLLSVMAQDEEVTPTASPVPDTYVSSVAWSRDGTMIAVGRATSSCEPDFIELYNIEILDAATQETLQTLKGAFCNITSIDWSPDSSKVAASTLDGLGAYVWDALTGQLVSRAQHGGQGATWIRWKPDGRQLVVGTVGNAIVPLNPEDGTNLNTPGFGGQHFDWSPDGSKLVSTSSYWDEIYVVDMVSGEPIITLSGHVGGSVWVDWSPDGSRLVSEGALDDRTIKVWDAITGENLLTIEHEIGGRDIRWSPDSTKLASVGDDGAVRVWDAVTGEELCLFQSDHPISALDWSPDGSQLVFGGGDGEITIVQLDSCPRGQNQTERK